MLTIKFTYSTLNANQRDNSDAYLRNSGIKLEHTSFQLRTNIVYSIQSGITLFNFGLLKKTKQSDVTMHEEMR